MYAMLGARPDCTHAVGILTRFMSNPTEEHIAAAKHLLKYWAGTVDWALYFTGDLKDPFGYTDADWAGDLATRRSTGGYTFSLGSGAISWRSKRQGCVAKSSCEAEYMEESAAASEAIWLRRLMDELGYPPTGPTVIYADNQGAIAMAKNPQFHDRSKHIAVHYHFVREQTEAGTVELRYIPTG